MTAPLLYVCSVGSLVRVNTRVLWLSQGCALLEVRSEAVAAPSVTREQLLQTMRGFAYDLTAEHVRRKLQ